MTPVHLSAPLCALLLLLRAPGGRASYAYAWRTWRDTQVATGRCPPGQSYATVSAPDINACAHACIQDYPACMSASYAAPPSAACKKTNFTGSASSLSACGSTYVHISARGSLAEVPIITTATCESGWSAFGQHCYLYVENAHRFDLGDAVCDVSKAKMASVHSQQENDFIHALITSYTPKVTFTGLLRSTTQGQVGYSWTDNSTLDYVNWDYPQGQPATGSLDPINCVVMDPNKAGLWRSANCYTPSGVICKKPSLP